MTPDEQRAQELAEKAGECINWWSQEIDYDAIAALLLPYVRDSARWTEANRRRLVSTEDIDWSRTTLDRARSEGEG